jgi:hypothetical protein
VSIFDLEVSIQLLSSRDINTKETDWPTAKMLLVLASTVILGSEPREAQNLSLLSVGSGILQTTVINKESKVKIRS